MDLLGDISHVESHVYPFRDRGSVSAKQVHGFTKRTIGSEIILDAPDGTPR
jgi:hypothetical protein